MLVQNREENIIHCNILQKARGDGIQCLRRGLNLNKSTDPCVMPGNNEKHEIQGDGGNWGDFLEGTWGNVLLISFIFSVKWELRLSAEDREKSDEGLRIQIDRRLEDTNYLQNCYLREEWIELENGICLVGGIQADLKGRIVTFR